MRAAKGMESAWKASSPLPKLFEVSVQLAPVEDQNAPVLAVRQFMQALVDPPSQRG
jgi:hypothetical protein